MPTFDQVHPLDHLDGQSSTAQRPAFVQLKGDLNVDGGSLVSQFAYERDGIVPQPERPLDRPEGDRRGLRGQRLVEPDRDHAAADRRSELDCPTRMLDVTRTMLRIDDGVANDGHAARRKAGRGQLAPDEVDIGRDQARDWQPRVC